MGLKKKEWKARGGKIKLFQPEFSMPMIINDERPKRNAPCPCKSGKKYKKCCLNGKPVAAEPVPAEAAPAETAKDTQLEVQQIMAGGEAPEVATDAKT